jgi:hypothetical protein
MPVLGFVAVLVFGLAQFAAGYAGIAYHFGTGWAIAALVVGVFFRFTLPITIGAFFGAMDVWGWHWALAALFAVPGLIFVVPGVIASVVSLARR